VTVCLLAGSGVPCLSRTLLAFFLLGLEELLCLGVDSSSFILLLQRGLLLVDGLAGPALLAIKPLFAGNSTELFSSEKNSGLSASLLLVDLLTLAELAALTEELLFVNSSAKLTLALLILEMGVIPAKGLAELVALVTVVDSPALLALLNCLVELPSVEFNSFKLS